MKEEEEWEKTAQSLQFGVAELGAQNTRKMDQRPLAGFPPSAWKNYSRGGVGEMMRKTFSN